MQIDITDFFKSVNASDLSASQLEKGTNAGQITWNNSMVAAKETKLLDTKEKLQAFATWVRASGGWSAEEIGKWSVQEANALFLQWVAGDMREAGLDRPNPDWEEYHQGSQVGRYASNIWRDDAGRIYFNLEI